MTLVRLGLTVETAAGVRVAAMGRLEFAPTRRRDVAGDVVLPAAFSVAIPSDEVELAPTELGWAWRVTEYTTPSLTRYVLVPDSASTVDYADLVDVDPASLEPSGPPPVDAWVEALGVATATASSTAVSAAESAVSAADVASTAAGTAASAASTAGTAATQAQDARRGAVEAAERAEAALPSFPGVVLIGHSFIQNWGGRTALLSQNLDGKPVLVRGIGGQTLLPIAARQGGIPTKVTTPNGLIPATGSITVTLGTPLGNGTYTGLLAGARVTIVVASGTATLTQAPGGIPMPCPAGAPFITGEDFRDHWPVFWVARNQITDPAAAVSALQAMLAYCTPQARAHALILLEAPSASETLGSPARANYDSMNAALTAAFPTMVVDVPAFMQTQTALGVAGVQPSQTDLANIAAGITPESFRTGSTGSIDTLHYNAAAYRVLNYLIPHTYYARGWITTPVDWPDIPDPVEPLHPAGVDGYDNRFVASLLTAAAGEPVSSWPNTVDGAAALTASGSGTGTASKVVDGGVDYVRQVNASGQVMALNQDGTAMPRPHTVAVVARVATGSRIFTGLGYRVSRTGDGRYSVSVTGTGSSGASTLVGATGATTALRLFVLRLGDTTADITLDGATTVAPGLTPGQIAAFATQATNGNLDTAELITWPRLLTDTEIAAVRTAMRAQYPDLA